jgi:hypothetical protein
MRLIAVVAAAGPGLRRSSRPNCKHLNTKCCSKCYVGDENEPCDADHYCLYQDPKQYKKVQDGGVCVFTLCCPVGRSCERRGGLPLLRGRSKLVKNLRRLQERCGLRLAVPRRQVCHESMNL